MTGTGDATTITAKDGTLQMSATVGPENATDKSVTWSVDDSNIATISETGLLTAVTNGTVTVKATSVSTPAVSGTLEITISNQVDAAEALAEAKTSAKAALDEYVNAADYTTNAATLAAAIADGKDAIDAAETTDAVATALSDAKSAIDEIKTDAELEAVAVAADRISQFNTFVDGVTLTTPEAGKAVFSFGDEVTWPGDQEPNVELGADPSLVYVDVLVKAPAGATKVLLGEEIVALDNNTNGTTAEGRLHYFSVAQKDSEGNIVGFSEAKTWELTYKWYNDSDQVIAVETLEVTREAYVLVDLTPVINTTKNKGYDTIQAAIVDADENDAITVGTGTYDEAISIIDKNLKLQGAVGATLTGGTAITGGNVTIAGFTINTKGVLASGVTGLTIRNNTFSNIRTAMEGSPGSSVIGLDVTSASGPILINDNEFSGIGNPADTGTAIRMVGLSGATTITGNTIEDVTKNGINIYNYPADGVNLTITGNTITNWDSDKDENNIGGRAIRIEFNSKTGSATINNNTLTPPEYAADFTPVDPEYVKITGSTNITKTFDWGSAVAVLTPTPTPTPPEDDGTIATIACYPTIQAAVDAADDFDIIQVYAGTYAEQILITNKTLAIFGEEGAILNGGLIASATSVEGKEIFVVGLEFETYGLEVDGYDKVTIFGNEFTNITSWTEDQLGQGSADAIYVHGSETGTALILDNIINGVHCDATNLGDGMGITVLDLDDITIDGNTISDTWHNSINVYQNVAGEVVITDNNLSNWDSNMDAGVREGISSGCEGGRALRVDLAAGASITVTGNTLTPPTYSDAETPVDPEYVKITGVDADKVVSLITELEDSNTWTDNPNFSVVILVNDTIGSPAPVVADSLAFGQGSAVYQYAGAQKQLTEK